MPQIHLQKTIRPGCDVGVQGTDFIGTTRRECLDQLTFFNKLDSRKLDHFQVITMKTEFIRLSI